MTEHRPGYNASSDDPHQQRVEIPSTTTVVPEYPSHAYPSKPDILLLVPILESPYSPGNAVCLCLVHLGNEQLGLCSRPSDVHCPCCLHPVCETHRTGVHTYFSDTPQDAPTRLCETCAGMTSQTRCAFHAFVVRLNDSPVLL